MNELTIKILYDNCKEASDLQEGWGFSAVIKTQEHNILFDTGNDQKAFFSNSEKMQLSLEDITEVFFSHKHNDHITGCTEILSRLKDLTPVYIPKGFPAQKIPQNLNVQTVKGLTQIDKGVFSLVLRSGLFLHEQALILETDKGLVIITGCAHPGITTIVETAQKNLKRPVYLVVGGFHLFKKSCSFVNNIIDTFHSLGVKKVAPCHCSGEKAIKQFEKAYDRSFYKIGTGTILTI